MKVYTILKNIAKKVSLDYVHPVGEIFISTDADFDPNKTWGGSWVKLTDKFLVGAGNDYALGDVGGEAEHTLTVDEMPSHSHNFVHGGSALCLGVTSGTEITSGFASGSYWANVNKRRSDIASTGGGKAHNNLPPYLAVNMWQRTA